MHTVDHYIHIGRDPDEQPKLEQSIQDRIIDIADNPFAVVNFVDKTDDLLERDILQKTKIVHSLNSYIHLLASTLQHPSLSLGFQHHIIDALCHDPDVAEIPIEIRDYCEKEIRNHQVRVEAKSCSDIEDVCLQFDEINRTTNHFLSTYFLSLCKKAIKKFDGQDLYKPQLPLPERNMRRRNKIIKFANTKLGGDRVFFSTMNNGDWSNFLNLKEECNKSFENVVSQNTGSVLEYGNAEQYLYELEYHQYLNRITRTSKQVKDILSTIGSDENTTGFGDLFQKFGFKKIHTCGGEYYNQCINAFGEILEFSGINKNTIKYDKSISLMPPK